MSSLDGASETHVRTLMSLLLFFLMACFFGSRSDVFLTAMQNYKQMTPFVCSHATAISALYLHTCVGAESTDHSTLIKLLKKQI